MAYSTISRKVSAYLTKELKCSQEKQAIIAYAVESILLTLAGLTVIILCGWAIGALKATLWAALAGGLLRKTSGGMHLATPLQCQATGAVVYSMLGYAAKAAALYVPINTWTSLSLIFVCVVCLAIVGAYAPVDSAAKPIISEDFRRRLRIWSLVITVSFVITVIVYRGTQLSYGITGGMLFQAITLLPFLNQRKGGELHA